MHKLNKTENQKCQTKTEQDREAAQPDPETEEDKVRDELAEKESEKRKAEKKETVNSVSFN